MRQATIRVVASGLVVAAMLFSSVGVLSLPFSSGTDPALSSLVAEQDAVASEMPQAVSLASGSPEARVEYQDRSPAVASVTEPDKPTFRLAEKGDLNEAQSSPPTESSRITASVLSNGNAPASGTNFDAGGPYGGPTCLEGSCVIHFEIVTDDPNLIFFRWDFNDDGVWDTAWSTDLFIDKMFYDNYYGYVKAEGWDGVSTRNIILMDTNLGEPPGISAYIYTANTGWKFKAKETLIATHLGYWMYIWQYPGLVLRLWHYATQSMLGSCTPSVNILEHWNWCTLSYQVGLVAGSEYMISFHKSVDNFPYWAGLYNQVFAWEKVEFQGYYFAWGMPMRFPDSSGGLSFVPKLDFRWRQVKVESWARQDKAFLDVRNVSPSPFNVTMDMGQAPEGSVARFTAQFDDPGLDDDWQYRWTFDNDTWTEWKKVDKYDGGARVLIYHSMTDHIEDFKEAIISKCGRFCLAVDDYDFGPLGQNKHLTLDYLMAYDVLYVETDLGPVPEQDLAGDLIADYMDQKGAEGSGGVVMGNSPFISNSMWEIRGRYFSDEYSPIEKASHSFGDWRLGAIYVPGHPIMDGVGTLTSYMHIEAMTPTSGATRIADWSTGRIAVATKPNPIVNNGARSVAMPWSAWFNCLGDCIQITVNAIRWASRQNDPTPLTMPFQLPWTSHIYKDDDPVTTSPSDNFTVKLEVKDDDHLKIDGTSKLVYAQDFATDCNDKAFPSGWVNTPDYGWRCQDSVDLGGNAAAYWYYYNDFNTSLLEGPTLDLGSFDGGRLDWRQSWRAYYPGASQDGYVETSLDGGMTYQFVLNEFHHNQPANEIARYSIDFPDVSSQFKVRFRIESQNDWSWIVDDVKIIGIKGYTVWGLGNGSSAATVNNVVPSIIGGPTSDVAHVGIPYNFTSLQLEDPALWEDTEWFAYMFDFGDGTPTQWIYKGSLSPPKLDILIIHSLCTSGSSCQDFMNMANMLNSLDVVASVTGYNFFEKLSAPTLSYLKNFDIVMFASSWAYFGYPPFDTARILIGNNMASYLDGGGGGVITWTAAYEISPSMGDIFSLLGRYIDQDYGPFEKGLYVAGEAFFPPTIELPTHPVMRGLNSSKSDLVRSGSMHSGNLATTTGGLRLASWYDGSAAVGVKDFNNDGRRSCAIGAYAGGYSGPGAPTLLRNCLDWVSGAFPAPELPAVSHSWSGVGFYTVDISVIDDDIGWTWDFANNVPFVDPLYAQTVAHRYIQIDVQS